MLYDDSAVDQTSPGPFDLTAWRSGSSDPEKAVGGRGTVVFLDTESGGWALRHYRRGGLPGRFLSDQFFYLGENNTRCFREFRLLAALYELGLPVPQPVAARYQRSGIIYRADLITARLPGARPLSQVLAEQQAPQQIWRQTGALIRRFHDAGVFHADLNAHNILVDQTGALHLLDFDRGRIRPPGRWRAANLQRLHRSILKISAESPDIRFGAADWNQLLDGYST